MPDPGEVVEVYHAPLWRDILEVLASGYTGPIVLHCDRGVVRKWDHTPRRVYAPEPSQLDSGSDPP